MRTRSRLRPIAFAFLLLVLLPWRAYGPGFEFEPGEYETLRRIAFETLSRFPPSRYAYVSMGRSPSPVMAIVHEIIGTEKAISLPASKLKWARDWENTSPEDQRAIGKHFNHYLSRLQPLDGRSVLVLDHVQSGLGLQRARDYLRHIYAESGEAVAVESLAIVLDRPHLHEHLTQYATVDHLVKYTDEKQLERFAGERYDNFAEYGSAVMAYDTDKLAPESPRPEYELLRQAVRKQMADDPLVRQALALAGGCAGRAFRSLAKP